MRYLIKVNGRFPRNLDLEKLKVYLMATENTEDAEKNFFSSLR
jgi:hypothetical protein